MERFAGTVSRLSPRGSRSREHLADVLWGRSADEQARLDLLTRQGD